ncbi:MAG: hypothetical protein M3317_11560 [Actinomycetota bacterium]|nr:hypothetical protein [Actinomycetota bacterium]
MAGAATLAGLILLLPLAGTTGPLPAARIAAYALILAPVTLLLHGFFVAAVSYPTSRLLAIGAVAAVLGLTSVLLSSPGDLENGSGVLVLLALCVADLSRILAAACVGIALARYVTSIGTALIIVLVAIASDLFSVFAGPTRMLVQENSPLLDGLLLVFPTFGSALGFGLGLSDFIFLALFAAAGRFLNLRYVATLIGVCFAAFLAVSAGLLLERPLPALPFIAAAFVFVNADLIVASLAKSR